MRLSLFNAPRQAFCTCLPKYNINTYLGRCAHQCIYCLPIFEKIILRINGDIAIHSIEDLLNLEWMGQGSFSSPFEPRNKIEVVSFNPETLKVEFAPISHITVHGNTTGKILKITTQGKRKVHVSQDHHMLILKDGHLHEIGASNILPGDQLVGAMKIPLIEKKNAIDLIELFCKRKEKSFIYGFSDQVEKWLFKKGLSKAWLGRLLGYKIGSKKSESRSNYIRNCIWRNCISLRDFLKLEKCIPLNRQECMIGFGRTSLPSILSLSKSLGYILGLYLAEGFKGERKYLRTICYGLHTQEKSIRDELIKSLSLIGIKRDRIRVYTYGKRMVVVINDALFAKLIDSIVPQRKALAKRLPFLVFTSPLEFRSSLIRGLFHGDATLRKNGNEIVFTTVSEWLHSEVFYLILSLSMVPRCEERQQKGKKKCYRLILSSCDAMLYKQTLDEEVRFKPLKRKMSPRHYRIFSENLYSTKVVSKEEIAYKGVFVDLEIMNEKPYGVFLHGDGIFSHNCYAVKFPSFVGPISPRLKLPRQIEGMARNTRLRLPVMMSDCTDPYQPLEKEHEITRRCAEVLAKHHFPILIVTKSDLVTRDIDVFKRTPTVVSITVTTPRADIAALIEPYAPPPERRIMALQRVAEQGIATLVRIDPIIPTVNDDEVDFEKLVSMLADAGVRQVTVATMKPVRGFFIMLKQTNREVFERLMRAYADGVWVAGYKYLHEERRRRTLERLRPIVLKYGLEFASCREGGFSQFNTTLCDGTSYCRGLLSKYL